MKTKLLLSLILSLCLSINLTSQKLDWYQDQSELWYRPSTGYSSVGYEQEINSALTYHVRVFCYDWVPYKADIYIDTNQLPVSSVTFWDSSHIIDNGTAVFNAKSWQPIHGISIEDTLITIRDLNQISLFVVNCLTGDTVVSNVFPEPDKDSLFVKTKKLSDEEKERFSIQYGNDFTQDIAMVYVPKSEFSISYSLPTGRYFAYLVNTCDGRLRWIQPIVKE